MEAKMTAKRQTRKVGVAGGFINQMMGNNDTLPVVGEYCTFLHYSDRTVGIVKSVSKDGMECVIEACDTEACLPEGITSLPMGHQSWRHIPSGHESTYRWMRGKWRRVYNEIVFTDEFVRSSPSQFVGAWLRGENPELADKVFGTGAEHTGHLVNVVDGVTRLKRASSPVSVIFGVCDYHYDWSF